MDQLFNFEPIKLLLVGKNSTCILSLLFKLKYTLGDVPLSLEFQEGESFLIYNLLWVGESSKIVKCLFFGELDFLY